MGAPKFKLKENILTITYDFNEVYLETLLLVKSNNGIVEFINREEFTSDIDHLELSWVICDELVSMGLLFEDLEAMNVTYELTKESEDLINSI